MNPLPDGSRIRVRGVLDERFRAALRRLVEGPEFTREFILSDVAGSYWRVFTEYAGDISGRFIGAVSLGRTCTGESLPLVDEIAREVAAVQREDGHFNLEHPPDRIYYPLAYGHGRLLLGLVEYCSLTPDPAVLRAVQRLADWYVAIAPHWRAPEVVSNCEFIYYTQGLEGLVGAYRLTGDARHLRACEEMADLLWEEPRHHSHSYLSSLLGILALHEATGDPRRLDFVEARHRDLCGMVTVDGGVTEMLPDKHVTEFCSDADWFMLNLRLWRATGKPDYLERAERSLFNAMFFNQFASGGFGTWRVNKQHGYPGRVEVGSAEAYWCCCFHGVRALYEALVHICTCGSEGVSVNFYFPCQVVCPGLASAGLRLDTDYPESGRVRITVSVPEPRRFGLRLRVPAWAASPTIRVNGAQVPVEVRGGFAAVEREWHADDRVELGFAIGLRVEDAAGRTAHESLPPGTTLEGATLWHGPVLLAADELYNARGPTDEKEPWTAPSRLLMPAQGWNALRSAQRLGVPSQWPGIQYTLPVAEGKGLSPGWRDRVVLTPLARRTENQPACAPSTRIRFSLSVEG